MSPVSRGRKGKRNKKSTRGSTVLYAVKAEEPCDCPACAGEDFDPEQVIDALTADAADLVGFEDPLDVELAGAAFVSIGAMAGDGFEEALVGGFIPQFAARASTEAMAMLLAIGSVAGGQARAAALAAADRLVEAGIPRPRWAAELGDSVTVADGVRLSDPHGSGSVLACSFHRAGRSHAVVMRVDDLDCGAAGQIILLSGAEQLPEVLETLRASGRDGGFELVEEPLNAADLRWHVEKALDARAVHDSDEPAEMAAPPVDEDGMPDYATLAVLMRARMNVLPVPRKPAPPHEDAVDRGPGFAALQMLAQRGGTPGSPFGVPEQTRPRGAGKLPAKRKKSDGPAPIYQIKVGLRGAKPPIWRRLQMPADISLARLHTVIQIAFGWEDSHLHVFETPYGDFGTADPELGYRADAPVTLEQVAPAADSKLRYTYDFGDDWEHEILVEKVLDRDESVTYPRCTGGRRAAPPEDCGGVWGYADLVEILSDPTDLEHKERLEWLGLDDAADFDPGRFDAQAVTRALASLG